MSLVETRQIEELVNLPLITDPDVLDVLDVLTATVMSANFTDENLYALLLCRMVSLSLENGNSDAACFAYVSLGMIAGPAMNTVEDRSRDLIIRTQCSEEGVVMVTVRDSGIGLDSSSMEKVFAAFHTTKPGGLGMGLSISRSIVENHHGRLWVSAHDGPGASFHFTLLTA